MQTEKKVKKARTKWKYGKSKTTAQADDRRRKRLEAEARNTKYESLTDQEKLILLDARLGEGVGASKQRAEIAARVKANAR